MYPNQPLNQNQQQLNPGNSSNQMVPYPGNFNHPQVQLFQNQPQNTLITPNTPAPSGKVKPKINYLFIFIILALVFFSTGVGYFLYENRGGFSSSILKVNTEGVDQSLKITSLEPVVKDLDIKNVSFGLESQISKFDNDPNKPAINPALYKAFTGPEFSNYYNNFEYTNVTEITTKPPIRSTPEADKVIQTIAETRGYKLRSEANESRLVFVDGQKLQPEAQQSWLQLKTAASGDNIELVLTSGYRSIIDQKNLFNNTLNLDATKDAEIAAGSQDTIINETLKTTSIPGYSRHHSGYTIDISCGNRSQRIFRQSECYDWISRFNYLNAKRFGFLPSYPEGSPNQGPDPEAWEYVWVGERNLRN